jgi:hypothetical protein
MGSAAAKPENTNQAVKHLESLADRIDAPLGQTFVSIVSISQLFPLLVTFFLGMIAVSEATHIVNRGDATFVTHPVFRLAYHIRWCFGLMAVFATIAPSAILCFTLKSLP